MSPVIEAFVILGELGAALNVTNINQLPGCWELQIDERWWISVNAHKETIKNSHGLEVPACYVAVEYNGWPAGLYCSAGGIIAAGEAANENTFIAAVRARIEREQVAR